MMNLKKWLLTIVSPCLMISSTSFGVANDKTSSGISKVVYEIESITVNTMPPNLAWDIADANVSAGSWNKITAFKENQWVEYSVYVENPGTYNIKLDSINNSNHGKYQLFVEGNSQGVEVDQYSRIITSRVVDLDNITFLTKGYKIFKFQVTGKNGSSSDYFLGFDKIELVPTSGFTLLSPNASFTGKAQPTLRWNAFPGAESYKVYINGKLATTVSSKITSYQAGRLADGNHSWYVVSISGKSKTKSNVLTFAVGDAPAYEHRDYSDDFESGNLDNYTTSGMSISTNALKGNYSVVGIPGSGPAYASVDDVTLEKIGEGEVMASIKLETPTSKAGVGFRADDGTFIYAIADAENNTFRLERRVKGYSILDERVTPKKYQIVDIDSWESPMSMYDLYEWTETSEDDYYTWTMESTPVNINDSTPYVIKLSYSRRGMNLMATLEVGLEYRNKTAIIRDMADLRTMNHPAIISTGGKARFDDIKYERLDTLSVRWDPDSVQVVMTPTVGTWDEGGVLNPAVLLKDDIWHMIYRGQAKPAPGDMWGIAASEIGYATSEDGINWKKYEGNPVIKAAPYDGPDESIRVSIEDPDMLFGEDGYVYLEMRDHWPYDGEVMWKSKDFINWEHAYDIARPKKDRLHKRGYKIGAMIDAHTSPNYDPSNPEAVEFLYERERYRYLGTIERGRLILSKDISANDWVYLDLFADYNSEPSTDWNPYDIIYIGDAFYDEDGNIRASGQASPDMQVGGQPECTNLEVILDGIEPWNVLHTSRLPYLQGWYGRAVTGSLDEMTAWDGSTFPGNTVEKDGWLWLYNGANNTMNGVIKCYNNYIFETRNLTLSNFAPTANMDVTVSVIVRNIGNKRGTSNLDLTINGNVADSQSVSLEREEEKTISFILNESTGIYTVGIGSASATMVVR